MIKEEDIKVNNWFKDGFGNIFVITSIGYDGLVHYEYRSSEGKLITSNGLYKSRFIGKLNFVKAVLVK